MSPDTIQRKPSEVCAILYPARGAVPSRFRQELWTYWVSRLFGSRAWSEVGNNHIQPRQMANNAAIALRREVGRSRRARRKIIFPIAQPNIATSFGPVQITMIPGLNPTEDIVTCITSHSGIHPGRVVWLRNVELPHFILQGGAFQAQALCGASLSSYLS